MACKAVINSSYRIRLGLLAGMMTFWFAYCMYDGYYAYPRQRTIARQYASFKSQGKLDQWPAHARSRGWPDGTHGDPGKDHSEWDIYTQYIMGYGVLPFAIIFCVSFFKSFRRWIVLEDDGLATSWGQRVGFGAVTGLDMKRWRTKGIAVVIYQDQGKQRKLVLDNFKYSPDEIATMVGTVESRLSPQQDSAAGQEANSKPDA